jgi:hypothetical protein
MLKALAAFTQMGRQCRCFHIDGLSASHCDIVLFLVCVHSLWGSFSSVCELLKMLLVETSE